MFIAAMFAACGAQAFGVPQTVMLTSCSGDVFVVPPDDTCSAYTHTCAGWTSVKCDNVGATCANGNDKLLAGDKSFVYGTDSHLSHTG